MSCYVYYWDGNIIKSEPWVSRIPNQRIIDPESLRTDWDREDDYSREQYENGLEIGSNAQTVYIAINNVWAARNKDGSHTGSYEKLGYHRSTRELFLGFIDSRVEIIIY